MMKKVNHHGFTLLELLVVMVIIALLAVTSHRAISRKWESRK